MVEPQRNLAYDEERKGGNETVDYIITTEQIAEQMQEVNVDQNGLYRLKGRVESDHNTIVLSANLNMWKEKEKNPEDMQQQ